MHTSTDTSMQLKAAARPAARRVVLPCAILKPAGAGRNSSFGGDIL